MPREFATRQMARRGGSHGSRRPGQTTRVMARPGSSSSTVSLRGLFADNQWYCDCKPRAIAEHFKVKKEGKNKGRWFYTCQKAQEERCGFFLWDEDAKLRSEAALLANGRTEVRSDNNVSMERTQQDTGRGLFATPAKWESTVDRADSSTPSPPPSPSVGRQKRTASNAGLDQRSSAIAAAAAAPPPNPWSLTPEEEDELAEAAAASSGSSASAFETPRKSPKTGVYATPATAASKGPRKLPWLAEQSPLTPASVATAGKKKTTVVDFFTPSKQPLAKSVSFQEPAAAAAAAAEHPATPSPPPGLAPVPATPAPQTRQRDALTDPAPSTTADSLTSQVLTALQQSPVAVPPEALTHIRGLLAKHELRAEGVARGRDISRLALRAKEARIVELEARIASLEAERELDRAVIVGMRRESGEPS